MAAVSAALEIDSQTDDVLAQLPISRTAAYSKGQLIYGPDKLSANLYLVLTGSVGISQIADDGSEVLLEIVRPDELFGESAFLEVSRRSEQATAIEKAKLMTWAVSEMEDLVMKRPRLAVALLQVLARRNADFTNRIESLAVDSIERRLARSLLRFSERLGSPEQDGSVRMMPFTHEMLSQYVGASREMVSHYMNRFRALGYVSYSRQAIFLHCDMLKTLLSRNGVASAGKSN